MTGENLEGQPIAFKPGQVYQVMFFEDVIRQERIRVVAARPAFAGKPKQTHVLARCTNKVRSSSPDDIIGGIALVSDTQRRQGHLDRGRRSQAERLLPKPKALAAQERYPEFSRRF